MKMKKQFIILVLIVLNLACSALTFAKPQRIVYLIPKGYTGSVIIVYKQADGILPEIKEAKEFDTILYRIPNDGLLKVKTDLPEHIINYGFYYVDEKDNQTPVEYLLPPSAPIQPELNLRSEGTITEEERNTGIFVVNHRSIGLVVNGQDIPLYAFIISHLKDASLLYDKTLYRVNELDEQLSKKP